MILQPKFRLYEEEEYYKIFKEIPFRKTMDTTEEEYRRDLLHCVNNKIKMENLVPEDDNY